MRLTSRKRRATDAKGARPRRPEPQQRLPSSVPAEAEKVFSIRSSLRLVRIRLVLALLAAAVIPLTLSTPFVFQLGQQLQAAGGPGEAAIAARRLDARLEAIRLSVIDGAADLDAADPEARAADSTHTIADLLVASAPGIVTGAWVVDGAGAPLATSDLVAPGKPAPELAPADAVVVADATRQLDAGESAIVVERDASGTIVYFAAPSGADGSAAEAENRRILVARVSLTALIADAQGGLRGQLVTVQPGEGGETLVLGGATGAESAGFADRLDPEHRAQLSAVGFEEWAVLVIPAPLQVEMPSPLFTILVVLSFAALGILWWLARQVVQPAEQLETTQSQLRELYETARTDALQDALTGLGNHRAFMEEFDRQIEESRRYEEDLSLLLLDLDDFKLVNDSAGHAAGDKLLVELGKLLGAVLRKPDRAYRIGGDEFAVLMPHTNSAAALVVARRLLALCTEPRRDSIFPRPFSFTGGISSCPEYSQTRSELFSQADAALYDGKRHGRTTVTVFDPRRAAGMIDQATRADLSAKVARVVTERLVRPAYQPVVDLRTGRVIGFEGLVRTKKDAPFDNPGALFAAAEAGGRTTELDFACIEAVLSGMEQIAPDQSLSINISPRSLEAAEFNTGSLLGLVTKYGADPRRITIEMTEREAVEDIERLRSVISACQGAGFRVAVDDVGAGNAGLRLLSQIHFDIVKIDLSLVQDGEQRETSLAVLRALADLAARWGALVVAEGVETPSQLWVIQELGMAAGQGYLLGKPADTPSARSVDIGALLAAAEADLPMIVPPRGTPSPGLA